MDEVSVCVTLYLRVLTDEQAREWFPIATRDNPPIIGG